MRLGIDLDGVVANFNAGWMNLYNEEFSADLTPDLVRDWNGLSGLTHFDSMLDFWRWAQGGQGPSVFRHLEVFPDAVDSLDILAKRHDIVIITTKPAWAIHDTYAWIADNRIPTNEIHVTSRKWVVACDVYLEDSPFQLPALVEHQPDATVCRFVRPWNHTVAGAVDIETWDDFVRVVEGLATSRPEHPEQHG